MSEPTRAQLVHVIDDWQQRAQRLLDSIAAEETAWLALSSTPTSMWLAAHHTWQVAADAVRHALFTATGSVREWAWLDIDPWLEIRRRLSVDELEACHLMDRYELDRRPIDSIDDQLRTALARNGNDYVRRLDDRAKLASRTLATSAVLAS